MRGEPDALRFAARQCLRGARKRQVVESYVVEESEARADLLDDFARDLRLGAAQVEFVDPGESTLGGHVAHVGDRFAFHSDGEHLGLEPLAVAHGARHFAHIRFVVLLALFRIGLLVPAHERPHHALEPGRVFAHAPPTVAVRDGDLEVLAIHDGLTHLFGQVLPRGVQVEAEV